MKKLLIAVFAAAIALAGCSGGSTNENALSDSGNTNQDVSSKVCDTSVVRGAIRNPPFPEGEVRLLSYPAPNQVPGDFFVVSNPPAEIPGSGVFNSLRIYESSGIIPITTIIFYTGDIVRSVVLSDGTVRIATQSDTVNIARKSYGITDTVLGYLKQRNALRAFLKFRISARTEIWVQSYGISSYYKDEAGAVKPIVSDKEGYARTELSDFTVIDLSFYAPDTFADASDGIVLSSLFVPAYTDRQTRTRYAKHPTLRTSLTDFQENELSDYSLSVYNQIAQPASQQQLSQEELDLLQRQEADRLAVEQQMAQDEAAAAEYLAFLQQMAQGEADILAHAQYDDAFLMYDDAFLMSDANGNVAAFKPDFEADSYRGDKSFSGIGLTTSNNPQLMTARTPYITPLTPDITPLTPDITPLSDIEVRSSKRSVERTAILGILQKNSGSSCEQTMNITPVSRAVALAAYGLWLKTPPVSFDASVPYIDDALIERVFNVMGAPPEDYMKQAYGNLKEGMKYVFDFIGLPDDFDPITDPNFKADGTCFDAILQNFDISVLPTQDGQGIRQVISLSGRIVYEKKIGDESPAVFHRLTQGELEAIFPPEVRCASAIK